jgi:hypothetical protein
MEKYNSRQLSRRAAMHKNTQHDKYYDYPKLHVTCLPAKCLRQDLNHYFSSFGKVIDIVYKRSADQSGIYDSDDDTIRQGFCTLVVGNTQTYEYILGYSPHVFEHRIIVVKQFTEGPSRSQQNAIQNRTRLFLKNFPPGTTNGNVENWLVSLGVTSPTCIYAVLSKEFTDSRIKKPKLTFNVQCQTIEDSEMLTSGRPLNYQGCLIRAETHRHDNRNSNKGPFVYAENSYRHPNSVYTNQLSSNRTQKSLNLVGSQEEVHRVASVPEDRFVSASHHSQELIPPKLQSRSLLRSAEEVAFVNNCPEQRLQPHSAGIPKTNGKNMQSQSGIFHQDSNSTDDYPQKSKTRLPQEAWDRAEAPTFSKHLQLRTTYCTSPTDIQEQDSANIRFNVIALRKVTQVKKNLL